MGLRDRREDRRDERRGGAGSSTYQMREKLFSIGDDYWIQNGAGERTFKVNGKALRVRETLVIEDRSGRELLKIQERKLRVRDTMDIEDADGKTVASVKKAMISPLRDRYKVEVTGGGELEVQGNIVDHEYEISRGRDKVAEVSKRWFRVADTYGIDVDAGTEPALILAIAVVVDSLSHDIG